ncbi:hypothetical protein [Pseudobacteriovorax antillogorgiicola]|uniref:Uncharacterized protein n=1 Tax=Pseudobacteriovorax antillogorgiicola TaxID=1513793 RepID=A0A1Y6CIY1_9BACT|nr:hypothetical protein [Pseudobacteriovorax antillogorgiicola]TCS48255.1 hypothetical protein EDD56_11835 [Pseudobacteriovorax antillogorgiicola]SMF57202.1 hypothetical protein SAMN06296036_118106 [Pseudobacteriovorax antillogorgiicola]
MYLQLRLILCLILASTQTSCISYRIHYHVEAWVSKPNSQKVRDKKIIFSYTHRTSTAWIAWACGLTFVAYGGACWLYQAVPFDFDIEDAEFEIRKKLSQIYGGDGFDIEHADIRFIEPGIQL